ncbi:MAG: hypothetical protein AAFX85_12915 [Pseudomonadota bacterium]
MKALVLIHIESPEDGGWRSTGVIADMGVDCSFQDHPPFNVRFPSYRPND